MIQDDEKYKSLRDALSGLPKVKAKSGFEARLLQRIKETEKGIIHKPELIKESRSKNWLANLFRPSFAPALGLTVVLLITIVVYFAYFSKMGDQSPQNEMVTSTDKQGEFVIYVKKDSESYSDNYPKEYSAITLEGTTEEHRMSPMEMPSDYLSRPEPPKSTESEIRNDRVSEEQKLEMERSVDREKGVDSKGERKSDDMIMKKESKSQPKGEMKKGDMKNEGEAPFNIRDEKEGYIEEDTNIQKQEQPSIKADEKTGNENEIFNQNDAPRIGRVTKDSSKTKSPKTEAEQEDSTDQK